MPIEININVKRRDRGEGSSKNYAPIHLPNKILGKAYPLCCHNLPYINFPGINLLHINPHNNLPYKWVLLILHLCPHSPSPLSPLRNCSKIGPNLKWDLLPYCYGQTYPAKSQVGLTGSQSRKIQEGSGSVDPEAIGDFQLRKVLKPLLDFEKLKKKCVKSTEL